MIEKINIKKKKNYKQNQVIPEYNNLRWFASIAGLKEVHKQLPVMQGINIFQAAYIQSFEAQKSNKVNKLQDCH